MNRYKFKDGQIGTIAAWQSTNAKGKVYGEFQSDTGACFTVEKGEVQSANPVSPTTRAALETAGQSEYRALSRADQENVLRDFADALREDNCGAIEYLRRIGAGNLQAYANSLRVHA